MTKRPQTKVVKFSESLIKRELAGDVFQLRDPRFPLRLRFNKSRTKATWHLVMYRNNKDHWEKLGDWPLLSFNALEKQLPTILAQKAFDPTASVSADNFNHVGAVLSWYQERSDKLKDLSKSTRANIKSVVKNHLLPALGDIALSDISTAIIDDKLIMPLQQIRQLPTVRLAFVTLKAAFNRAKKQKRISVNPLSDIVFSDFIDDTVKAKEGRLKKHQLATVLNALTHQKERVQVLVVLLCAYATRIGETRLATWSQFDFNARLWTIPKENTKTGKESLSLHLTEQIIFLLSAYREYQIKQGYQGQYLFPGHERKGAVCESTVSRWIKEFSQGEFSAHDFRKCARSVWAEIKIDYMVGRRLLNHALGGLDSAYYQTLIVDPKRDAIERYHDYLLARGLSVFCEESDTDPIPRSFFIYNSRKGLSCVA